MNSGEWGGVDVFVMRFAEHLRRVGRDFVIVDRASSRLRQDLPWARFLTSEEAKTIDFPVHRVFLPSITKLREDGIPWGIIHDSALFAWVVHHNDVLIQFFPHSPWMIKNWGFSSIRIVFGILRRHKLRIEKMLELMVMRHAIAVMDEGTGRAVEYFYPRLRKGIPIVPVPAPIDASLDITSPSVGPFTFGYLGRMDDIKFSALGSFVENSLAELSKTKPVRLLAITVGTHVDELKRVCSRVGVELDLRGFLANKEARQLLRNETQLGLAMGTSALDIAASGHPCIYIDPAERPGGPPQTSFRFVHETVNFTLGQYRDFPIYAGGVRSLNDTVSLVEKDLTIGSLGREYVKNNHDPELVSAMMLHHIDTSTLKMGDIEPYVIAIRRSNALDLKWVALARRFHKIAKAAIAQSREFVRKLKISF